MVIVNMADMFETKASYDTSTGYERGLSRCVASPRRVDSAPALNSQCSLNRASVGPQHFEAPHLTVQDDKVQFKTHRAAAAGDAVGNACAAHRRAPRPGQSKLYAKSMCADRGHRRVTPSGVAEMG